MNPLWLLLCVTVVSLRTLVSGQTFPPFDKCNQANCDTYATAVASTATPPGPATYTDARSLLYCCQLFTKCCTQANAIPCPPDDAAVAPDDVTTAQFSCPGFGPYCSGEAHCHIGQKCCRNPLYGTSKLPAPGTYRQYKCCWTVVKKALAS